ncbi:MAG: glycosyltransferase family 39 protein [Candidatus Nanohaloarchaea archaeon]
MGILHEIFRGVFVPAVQHHTPLLLYLTFISAFMLAWVSREELKDEFKDVSKTTWLALGVIFLIGIYTAYNFSEGVTTTGKTWKHVEMAIMMMKGESFAVYELFRPKAYPFILSVLFSIFGKSLAVIRFSNVLFHGGTSIAVFLSTYLITRDEASGLGASVLYAIMPLPISYATHGNPMTFYLLVVSLSLSSLLLALRTDSWKPLSLSMVLFVLAMSSRMEAVYFLGVLGVGGIIFYLRNGYRKLLIPALVFLITVSQMIPFIVWSPNRFGYNKKGEKLVEGSSRAYEKAFENRYPNAPSSSFSLSFLPQNLEKISTAFFSGRWINTGMWILVVVGMLSISYYFLAILPASWMLFFLLFFGTWFGTSINNMKFHGFQAFVPITILIGCGIAWAADKSEKILYRFQGENTAELVRNVLIFALVILLIVQVSGFRYYSTGHKGQNSNGFFPDLENRLVSLEDKACIMVEDKRIGNYVYSRRLVDFATDKEVESSPQDCGSGNRYYVKLKEKIHPRELPDNYFSLYPKLERDCRMKSVSSTETFEILELNCDKT